MLGVGLWKKQGVGLKGMGDWVSCKFFRLNFPYGEKQRRVERVYFRRKKAVQLDFSKFLPKAEVGKE